MNSIGIFDSGVGGLSIWREIARQLPSYNSIYLGDGVNAPYGQKSKDDIVELSCRNAEWLMAKGANMIVVACNTATTNAIESLRNKYDIPFVGIEPATKPAAINTKTGKIGILATRGTFASELFLNTSSAYRGQIEIIETIGTGLVPIVESGQLDKARPLLAKYLNPMIDQGIDNLVLGCTHYPFLTPIIREILPAEVSIVEPSAAISRQVKHVIALKKIKIDKTDNQVFYTTSDVEIMTDFVKQIGVEHPVVSELEFKP